MSQPTMQSPATSCFGIVKITSDEEKSNELAPQDTVETGLTGGTICIVERGVSVAVSAKWNSDQQWESEKQNSQKYCYYARANWWADQRNKMLFHRDTLFRGRTLNLYYIVDI